MTLKTVFTATLKAALLAILYLAADMAGSSILPTGIDWTPAPDQLPAVFAGRLLTAVVNTLVISLIVVRSGWSGWRLFGAVAVAWYGTMTFQAMVEAAWFGPALGLARPVAIVLALNAAPLVLVFTAAAIFVWGRRRPSAAQPEARGRLPLTPAEWLWKLGVVAAAYLVLYFGFGYVVAWQNPALRAMYDNGADPIVFNYFYLIPLQVARSALWVLFALPVIRMTRGPMWQAAVLVGLLFALPMNIGHFTPNPIMPDPGVRLSHFIETATSNFIFGLVVTLLLNWRPGPLAMKPAAAVKS